MFFYFSFLAFKSSWLSYNWRQNELRHFALNGLFDVFWTSKGEKIAFPPPSPPCNVVPLFELPLENKKHPNLNGGDRVGVWILMFSEVTVFEDNVSTILSPTVANNTSISYVFLINFIYYGFFYSSFFSMFFTDSGRKLPWFAMVVNWHYFSTTPLICVIW